MAEICFLADRIRFDWSQSDRHPKGGGSQWPKFVFWPIGFDSTGASRIGTQRGADPSGRHFFLADRIRFDWSQSDRHPKGGRSQWPKFVFWPIGFDSTGASRIGTQRGPIPVAEICFLADRIRFDWSQSDRHPKGGGSQWPTFVFWPIGFDSTGASRIGTQRGADPSGRHLFFGRSDSIRLEPVGSAPKGGPIPVAEICFLADRIRFDWSQSDRHPKGGGSQWPTFVFWPIGFDSTGASRIGTQRGADPSGRHLFFGRSDSIRLEPVGSAPKGGRIPVADICFLADRIRFDWSQSDRHPKGGGSQWPTFVFWPIGFDSTGASRIGTQRGADPSGRHLFFGRSDSIRLEPVGSAPKGGRIPVADICFLADRIRFDWGRANRAHFRQIGRSDSDCPDSDCP